MLEDRRKRLAAEGLFAEERKKKLPFLPEVIVVVTSESGAVIRDILHRLEDRFPRRVLLWPVAVQGEGAAEQVAAAIACFNALAPSGAVPRPDLLIVARGGGSLEDLMAFNEEIVVRAAAASAIPLISAVGHESDTTLIDYASDRRAPTPTAAAEMAVPVRLDLRLEIDGKASRVVRGVSRFLAERSARVEGLGRGLPDPRSILDTVRQRLDDRAERLAAGFGRMLAMRRHQLDVASGRLSKRLLEVQLMRAGERLGDALPRLRHAMRRLVDQHQHRLDSLAGRLDSYRQAVEQILAKGYVLVRDASGRIVDSVQGIKAGDTLSLVFHDGRLRVVAEEAAKRPATPRSKKPGHPDQGSLL
jgi:exodeoxyribonuclease VII large subunit